MKIGILGGTFNPVHFGHLVLADGVRESLSLDKVIFIPVNIPPHKDKSDIIDARLRLKMLRLAIAGNPYFVFSDIEIKRKGMSFTIDTLEYLSKKFKTDELFFIIGSDEIKDLDDWKDSAKIKKLVKLVVARRPGCDFDEGLSGIIKLDIKTVDISGYQIRRQIKEGKSIRYLLPERVNNFITKKQLYSA